jgi:hypothetical protein
VYIVLIAKLYAVQSEARDAPIDARVCLPLRQESGVPAQLVALAKLIIQIRQQTLSASLLAKAHPLLPENWNPPTACTRVPLTHSAPARCDLANSPIFPSFPHTSVHSGHTASGLASQLDAVANGLTLIRSVGPLSPKTHQLVPKRVAHGPPSRSSRSPRKAGGRLTDSRPAVKLHFVTDDDALRRLRFDHGRRGGFIRAIHWPSARQKTKNNRRCKEPCAGLDLHFTAAGHALDH